MLKRSCVADLVSDRGRTDSWIFYVDLMAGRVSQVCILKEEDTIHFGGENKCGRNVGRAAVTGLVQRVRSDLSFKQAENDGRRGQFRLILVECSELA